MSVSVSSNEKASETPPQIIDSGLTMEDFELDLGSDESQEKQNRDTSPETKE